MEEISSLMEKEYKLDLIELSCIRRRKILRYLIVIEISPARRHVKAELNLGQCNSGAEDIRQDIEPDSLEEGAGHTVDLMFP